MSTPYLGSKISLISRLDIRYEGILYTVDSNESTIALAKVRSFGTEDRPTERPVKARSEIYEYIIFKASDIKDLVVCEGPKESESDDVDDDPAIVSVSKPPPQQGQAPLPTEPKTSAPASTPAKQPFVGKPNQQQSASNQPPPYHQRQNWQPNNNRPQQQQQQQQPHRQPYNNRPFQQQQQQPGGYNNQRQNNPRPYNRNAAPKEKLKFDNDYDFEKANEQFKEKIDELTDDLNEKVAFHEEEEPNSADENDDKDETDDAHFYNKKSSFFDSISCESQEKADGKNNRPDWRKERQTNTETFGQNAVRSHAYHYRNRFNNQNRFQGNRPQSGGGQGGPRFNNPRPNNNGGQQQGQQQGYGNRPPRFNNRDPQQQQQNPRPNRAF